MCGIIGVFELKQPAEELRGDVLDMAKCIRHRGPDWSGLHISSKAILAHERLAIVDPTSGGQPLYSADKNLILAANGEIYNHKELEAGLGTGYEFQTKSDCEVILALYDKHGSDFLEKLNGIFAFALYDVKNDRYLIARDHMGIIPLYQGWDEKGNYYVASELKALEGQCNKIEPFLPGHFYDSSKGVMEKWYSKDWESFDNVKDNVSDKQELRKLETLAKYQDWNDAYIKLKKSKPDMSDVWYSKKIAKMNISQGKSAGTIVKKMKN